MTKPETTSNIATKLASDTANTAINLATTAQKTAADLASKTAETNTEIKTNMSWMMKSLGAIEQKLNEMDKAFVTAAQHATVTTELEDHETRLRKIEDKFGKWVGAVAVITFVVTLLGGYLIKFIK